MIFKTIDDNNSLSGQRIVSKFTARKIAQEEATKQLEIDIQCLRNYEAECQKGSVSTETFGNTMNGASIEAQKYATNIKNGTGSAQTFATNQRTIQASMSETSIVSKVAATGLSIFKAALNSLIFFAVIEGIQLLINRIDNLILTADEAKEKAEALRGNMQSFFDEVQSGQQTISSVSDRFSELSEHVTKTGENIDLTKDEYSEYLDICNQVKTIMPELVTGYTNEGNAIIALKDNVDNLTESYKENIRAKAAAFITNGDDDGNTIQSFFDDYKIFTEGENGSFAPSAGGLWNNKSTDYEDYYGYDKVHEWLEDVADLSLKDLQNLQKGTTQATYLYALLKENGYELANITEDNYEAVHDVLDTRLTSLEGEMATRVSNVKMSLQQMLYADRDYWDIDDKEALSAIDSMFSSIDSEFIKQNSLLGQNALQSFESNVIKLFENKDTQKAMIDIYTPQGDDEFIEDYSKRVNDAIEKVQNYAKDKKIDVSLDFTDATGSVEDLQKSYDDTINRFKSSEEANLEELKQSYQEAIDKRKELYSGENYVGNVDINNRPVVINDDGSYSTTSTSFQEKWVGDEENGHYIIAHFTPILPDGTVLDEDSLNEYIDKILNSDDPMEADKVENGGKGIVYKVDTKINGKEIKDDNLEDAFGVADAWDVDMHNLQDKMYKDEAKIKGQIARFGNDVDGSQKIKDFFDTEGINTQEEIDYFNDVTENAKTADDAIKKYKTSLEKSQKSSFKSFKEAWADLDKVSDDSDMKDTKKELLELAEAGKLTEKTFKNVSGSDTFLNEIGISSKKAIDNINHLVESTKQLSSMKTGISSIREAYSTRKDNKNKLGADTLSSMYDTLGIKDWSNKDKKVWTEYKNAAEDTSVSMDEFKKKQDALATSFVNTGNYLGGITKQSKERYVAMLKEMGVINAEEVATKALETKEKTLKEAKDKLGISSKELKSINLEEADALDDLDLSVKGAAKALYDYMIQKIQCGKIKLDTATECTNLYNLALKAGIAASKLRELLNAQIQYNTYERVSSNVKGLQDVINSADDENKEITFTTADGDVKKFKNKQSATNQLKGWGTVAKNAKSRAEKNVEKFNKKNKVNLSIQTQKGSGKDKKDKNSSSKDKSKSTQVIDWIERRLNRLNSTIDYTTSKLQNMFTIKQKSNEIDKQIKTSTKLIKSYGIATDKYKKKANQVAKSSTKTVTNSKGKKKKKKVSGLSNRLIKNIQNGSRLKGKKLSDLIATYGEDTAEKIQSYQDYWDKYQDALKNKQDEIAKRRQYKIDKEQNYVDKADEKYNKNEALKENAKSASEKNIILKDERENLKDSYKHQIEIAKINKDKVEQARLNAELQKKLNDIAIEQHQNIVDELDRNNEALEAQKQNLKTASEKNSIVEQQKVIAQQTYAEQIEIAKLQYGVGSDKVKKLQEEQKSKLADFENEKFENIQTEYSNWLDMIQSRIDGLDGSISIVEAKGITATQGLYQGKVAVEKENLSTLQAEKVALEEQHKSTEVGTALWYSQEKSLNDVSTAIINAQKNMIEYRNSIREANNKVLELKKSFIDLGNIYLDNFEKYLSRYSLTDEDTGGLTDKGVATLGIYRKQSISAGEQQKIDMDKLNEIEDIIARYNIYDDTQKKILLEANNYDSFVQVKEDYEKYAQAVQDDISNRISAEENIINLMKERYNAELSYIQKLIDDRKQQLSDEKDLYDYQKSIQEKVDNISLLQKQLDALRNDGSEEAMQRRNNIQDQLDNSKEDLTDVEYDKYISDQQNMLDKLSEDYQNLIEDLLQDVDTLLNEGNEIAKNNGDKFEKAINGFTEKYGQTPFTQQQIDVAAIKTAVEKEQKDQDTADEVLSAIEKIGTVDLNGEGRGRLVNAENLYNSLTDAQRKIVDENPNGLTLLQKKQQEWVALQAPTQTSIPTSQPSSTPQQSATEAKRAEERKNQQKAQFEQLIKKTYWKNSKYGTKKLFKDNGKETDYTKVQKKIAKNYKRDDFKYVNADWIKEVCKRLGIAQSAGSLLNYMNGIGFSKGGIVETLSKVPGRNGDDGWATLKRGEAILTPEQTKMFQSMIKQMPVFTNAMDIFSSTKSSTGVNNKPNSVSVGDINLTLDLPNVTDSESFIKEMQSNSRMRKVVQQAVLDEVVGKGNFNIKRL